MMGEKYKSGRDAMGEHRHDDYRMYNRLLKAMPRYEESIPSLKIQFRSKYTLEEMQEALNEYNGDEPELYLQSKKDSQFRDFLIDTSLVECRTSHSCAVVRSHNPLNGHKESVYKWFYHSLEEYLTEIYNNGDDFILYITHLDDMLLKREDEFEYIFPVNAAGEMLVRSMRHDPYYTLSYRQEHYMLYTLLGNPDMYGNCRMFTDQRYNGKIPKSMWPLNSLPRCRYKSPKKYRGEA